jgi:hypothetical protein
MDMPLLTFLATIVLAGITAWYARSTAQILSEMKRQSSVLTKAAQLSALAVLVDSAEQTFASECRKKIRDLLTELEARANESV